MSKSNLNEFNFVDLFLNMLIREGITEIDINKLLFELKAYFIQEKYYKLFHNIELSIDENSLDLHNIFIRRSMYIDENKEVINIIKSYNDNIFNLVSKECVDLMSELIKEYKIRYLSFHNHKTIMLSAVEPNKYYEIINGFNLKNNCDIKWCLITDGIVKNNDLHKLDLISIKENPKNFNKILFLRNVLKRKVEIDLANFVIKQGILGNNVFSIIHTNSLDSDFLNKLINITYELNKSDYIKSIHNEPYVFQKKL